jgi:hypothetical protein
MRAGRYSIIVGILVLIAGLVKGLHFHARPASGGHYLEVSARSDVRHVSPVRHYVIAQGESSDNTQHKERRHGKSLVSQAIVADCPITVLPEFTYFHRHYSLFLPGGCTRQFIGNFSLRGPPAC